MANKFEEMVEEAD
jgi:WD40 repeat protein